MYGAKEVAWTDPAPGAINAFGEPALWQALKGFNSSGAASNDMWARGPSNWYKYRETFAVSPDLLSKLNDSFDKSLSAIEPQWIEVYLNYVTEKYYEPVGMQFLKNQLPTLNLTKDEDDISQAVWHEAHGYAQKQIMAFVTGEANIDSGWEAYVTEANRMGLADIVAQYQSAYDRMMKCGR
jgi:hypothetical protein